MSIWGDIKKSRPKAVKDFTMDEFTDFLKTFEVKSKEPAREFNVITGKSGMQMIQDSMQTQVYLNLMKNLNFSREERKRLGEMIKSPDPENFQVAKILIDNKMAEAKEYHGNSNSKK